MSFKSVVILLYLLGNTVFGIKIMKKVTSEMKKR